MKRKLPQVELVPKPLEVNATEGFAQDKLNREPFGEAMRNIILNTSGNIVISLDGGWGSGKTTFLRMWQGLLKESGVASIYIDAFKKDYTEDAFLVIAAAILEFADQHVPKEKYVEIKEILSLVAKNATKWGMEKLADGVFSHIGLTLKDVKNWFKKPQRNLDLRLKLLKEGENNIEEMRKILKNLPEVICKNSSGKLVVIIDELDRCKPSFAIEVIEKIKHLFSVENIVFVLGVNRKQLEASIKHIYGAEIDARTYLRKFVSLELKIPSNRTPSLAVRDITGKAYKNEIEVYADSLIKGKIFNCMDIGEMFGELQQLFNISLRDTEQILLNSAIFYNKLEKSPEARASQTTEKPHFPHYEMTLFLSALKLKDLDYFESLIEGQISAEKFRKDFEKRIERIGGTLKISFNDILSRIATDEEFSKLPVDLRRRFNGMDSHEKRVEPVLDIGRRLLLLSN